ncbi:PREDICTED: protein Spindly [Gekko japonicus]|uniref:Protein Spindly n=1 Tax=Gekko japonicus TaxID=146911 RepID=A0ABM1LG65_GEKJA|nr:PREDICTED: protein Spindly [Gekko japonicus]
MEIDKEIISRLRSQLKEAEEERRKAAQYGLELMEGQNVLQNQLDELQNEMVTLTETFEQEKYTLQRELELKTRMLGSLNAEYDTLKQLQNIQLDTLREQLERLHGQEINELKNKVEKLKSELDESLLSEKQLKHKVDHLKEVITSKSEELRVMSERVHETMSSEVLSLQHELIALENSKGELEDRLHELQYSKEQLELVNSNLSNRASRLEEEREDKEKDLASYCNALEKAREVNRELQAQLDHALQEALDPSSKGNSLFAEVEDKRAEMAHQLISAKVKYQLLQKQHTFMREQLQRIKLQMATLLRMKGSQGEHDQLERLQNMLQQKNSEIEELIMKVKQLEKSKVSENSKELMLYNVSECTEFGQGYYTDLLRMKLENSDKEIENLRSELSLQRMKALFENQRVLEIERKLFASERQLEACQSDSINLQVLLEELRIKYEPEELMKNPISFKKAPGNVASANSSSMRISAHETASLLSQTYEEIISENAMKTSVQAVPMNVILPSAMHQKTDQPEKKRVSIKEEEPDRKSIKKKDGNDTAPYPVTRSTSELGVKTEENYAGAAQDASKQKKSQKKTYPVIRMSSRDAPETQCAQQ